jgi:hypothetical protein
MSSSNFESFWQSYPAHRRQSKATCLKKWEQKKLDDKATLIVGHVTKRAKEDKAWLDGFIPLPATFLHQEKWNDEYETVKHKQAKGRPVEELLPQHQPQPDGYKALLNSAILKMLMHAKGVTVDKLRQTLRVRNEIAAEWRLMWGDKANNDELKDLSAGYLAKLKGALHE